jgi:hypothetical protein
MQKRTTIITLSLSLILAGLSFNAYTNSGGSPAGHSGSPISASKTCARSGCHSGGNISSQTVQITTNIPAGGYDLNQDYTITVTAKTNGVNNQKVGFNASVENAAGIAGTTTPSSGTQFSFGSNFLTHTSNSNSFNSGERKWTFIWNPENKVEATVYVAVNFANGDDGSGGDAVKTETLKLMAKTMSVSKKLAAHFMLNTSLSGDNLMVDYVLPESGLCNMKLISIEGKNTSIQFSENQTEGKQKVVLPLNSLSKGIYILNLSLNGTTVSNKVLVN